MSTKIPYKSEFLILRIIIVMTLWLPGLYGLAEGYFLFFFIYTAIWYYLSSFWLTQIYLSSDEVKIKFSLAFWKKDKIINYSNVIEFEHHVVPRGQDELWIRYKDSKGKTKKIKISCKRPTAKAVFDEIKESYPSIEYKTYDSFLHN